MSTQITLDFDICSRRHRNNPQSVAAHSRIVGTKQATYAKIEEYVAKHGPSTGKEIAEGLGKQFNTVSGRYAEMKALGRLKETGERRLGSAELSLVTQ